VSTMRDLNNLGPLGSCECSSRSRKAVFGTHLASCFSYEDEEHEGVPNRERARDHRNSCNASPDIGYAPVYRFLACCDAVACRRSPATWHAPIGLGFIGGNVWPRRALAIGPNSTGFAPSASYSR